MSHKPKAAPVVAAINVIPMADIMLALLIIFMVITPMFRPGMAVDMPEVAHPREMHDAEREDALVVAISRDGAIFLGLKQLSLRELQARISSALTTQSQRTVFVKGDQRAQYRSVVEVVDALRASGVEQLGLLTEKSPLAAQKAGASWE